MHRYQQLYVDGAWQTPTGPGLIDVLSASTGESIGCVPEGTPEDVDRAAEAARRALPAWRATPPTTRAEWLDKIAAGLEARAADIARTIAMEVGTPISVATPIQAGLPVVVTRSFAKRAADAVREEEVGNSLIVRESAGVVAAITPWNYPLHQIMAKVAAALAAGCTVVLKPSEVAPLNACILAEVCEQIALPQGLLNIVHGAGAVVGEAMATHPLVDVVSFTGSLRAGRRVMALAADTVKRVTLELGGKSANVILDDAPLEKAVGVGVKNAMLNSGQTCSAWTRMIVPRAKHDEAIQIAVNTLAGLKLGDPMDPATRLGPLVSAAQRERVEGYIQVGKDEGATIAAGGSRPGFDRGYFVAPTIFAGVDRAMRIAQEEIFGPVLSILPYDSDDDAVAIANDSIYGLAGGVWSADADRALAVARQIRTGQVDINGGRFNPLAPFGGYKQSGVGRELGAFGLDEYLQIKSIQR
ncbi:MAG: aldehyde dehydrogenase family protein [Bryobacteraceae bacterium]